MMKVQVNELEQEPVQPRHETWEHYYEQENNTAVYISSCIERWETQAEESGCASHLTHSCRGICIRRTKGQAPNTHLTVSSSHTPPEGGLHTQHHLLCAYINSRGAHAVKQHIKLLGYLQNYFPPSLFVEG